MYINTLSCYCYLSNSNTKYTRQITYDCNVNPKDLDWGCCYTRLKKIPKHRRAKVIGGCKHPCSTPQPHSFFWIFLLHPCHSSDPWIYDGFVVCWIHCGPALDPGPWNGAETPCVCAHCSRGAPPCGCGHGMGHSGPHVRGCNLPLAPRRQSLDSLGFLSQMSLAWRGLDLYHCDGCGAGLRRKPGAGISWLVPGRVLLQLGMPNGQEQSDQSSDHLENPGVEGGKHRHHPRSECKELMHHKASLFECSSF